MSEGPKYLVEFVNEGPELFETLQEARDAFDAEVERLADEAGGDGWAEEAEYLPRLSVCHLRAEHGLASISIEQVEADGDQDYADTMRERGWDFYADGKVAEYPDPVAALTAERDAAIAERNEARTEASHLRSRCAAYEAALGQDHADTVSDLAMLSAARDADRAMLGRIIGCEQSDASMVVLLERVEAMLAGLCVPGFVPPALEDEMNNTAETAWLRRQGFFDDGLVMRVAGWGGWVRWDDGLRQWEGVDASGVERCDPRVANLLRRSGFRPVGVPS